MKTHRRCLLICWICSCNHGFTFLAKARTFGGAEAHGKTKDPSGSPSTKPGLASAGNDFFLLASGISFLSNPTMTLRFECSGVSSVCVCVRVTSELVLMIENIELSIPEQMRSSFCCLKCRWMWCRTTGSRILRDSEGTQNRHTSLLQFRFIWEGPRTRYIMAVRVSVDRNPTTSLLFTGTAAMLLRGSRPPAPLVWFMSWNKSIWKLCSSSSFCSYRLKVTVKLVPWNRF